MALSNKFGWLVLTTGNKSEMSVGYTTLYGDLAGGFAVIKDVPKTLVYRLCTWRNSLRPAADAIARRPAHRGAARDAIPASQPRSPDRSSSARPRPSCAPTSATRTRCPPTTCSTASSRATSSSTEPRAADRPGAARSGRRAHDPPRRPRRVQAPPGAARHQDHPARVRARPAHADHQPLPRLATRRRARYAARAAPLALLARCARSRWRCGNTLQDQPIPHNVLEGMIVAPVPRVLARRLLPRPGRHRSRARPERRLQRPVRQLPAGRRGRLRAAAAGRHLARQQLPARGGSTPHAHGAHQGRRRARSPQQGRTIVIPTGGVVVDIYAATAALARAAARTIVPINAPGAPGERRCRQPLPDTRLRRDAAARAGARAAARAAVTRTLSRSPGRSPPRSAIGRTAIVMRVSAHVRP